MFGLLLAIDHRHTCEGPQARTPGGHLAASGLLLHGDGALGLFPLRFLEMERLPGLLVTGALEHRGDGSF